MSAWPSLAGRLTAYRRRWSSRQLLAAAGVLVAVIAIVIWLANTMHQPDGARPLSTASIVSAKASPIAARMAERARASQRLANQEQALENRLSRYRQAIDIVDNAEARFTDFRAAYPLDGLFDEYVAVLVVAGDSATDTTERRTLYDKARHAALRLNNGPRSIRRLRETARRMGKAALPDDALSTLVDAYRIAERFSVVPRDVALAAIAATAAPLHAPAREAALTWAETITDPAARSDAMMIVSRFRLAHADLPDKALRPYRLSRQVDYDRNSAAMLSAADELRQSARPESAEVLALAASRQSRGRDGVLAAIADEQAATTSQFEKIRAPFAIQASGLRDVALAGVARSAITDTATTDARRLVDLIGDGSTRAELHAKLMEVLSWRGYQQQVDELAGPLLDLVYTLPRDERREVIVTIAGRSMAAVGLADKAERALSMLSGGAARDGVRFALARRAQSGKQFDAASHWLDVVEMPANRPIAARLRVQLMLDLGNVADAVELAREIEDPVQGIWARAITVPALRRSGRLDEANAMVKIIRDAANRSAVEVEPQMIAAAIYALAAVDLLDRAEMLVPFAMSEDTWSEDGGISYERALVELASGWVRVGRIDRAKKVSQWAVEDRQRWLVMRNLAQAMAEQGMVRQAAEFATTIGDALQRVNALRNIADLSADRLDSYNLLDSGRRVGSPASEPAEYDEPVLRMAGYDIYSLQRGEPGATLPALPDVKAITVDKLTASIPSSSATNARRVRVLPMGYNAYNTKFESGLNLAFRDLGQGYFAEGPQDTRYPRYIHIERGVYDASSLARDLRALGYPDALRQSGRKFLLNLPIFIAPEAELVLAADTEVLQMEQARGTFMVNAGKVWAHDVDIVGWESLTNAPSVLLPERRERFRPFIISWGGSQFNAAETRFRNLGFESSKAYGLSFSQGTSRVLRTRPAPMFPPRGQLIENSFEDMYFGLYTYAAENVAVIGNEYRNNIVYGIDPHDFSKALLIALNSTYGSREKHGIIGSRSVDNSWFVGNLSFRNGGTGLMVERRSSTNLIYANRIWGNGGDGISIFESPCNLIAANHVDSDRNDAVKVRNSWNVGIYRNVMRSSAQAVVNVYIANPEPGARHAARNVQLDPFSYYADAVFAENRFHIRGSAGIGAVGLGAALFKDNAIIGGRKKLLSGDLARYQNAVFGLAADGAIVRSGCPAPQLANACPFVRQGYLPGGLDALPPASGSGCAQTLALAKAGGIGADGQNVSTPEAPPVDLAPKRLVIAQSRSPFAVRR